MSLFCSISERASFCFSVYGSITIGVINTYTKPNVRKSFTTVSSAATFTQVRTAEKSANVQNAALPMDA